MLLLAAFVTGCGGNSAAVRGTSVGGTEVLPKEERKVTETGRAGGESEAEEEERPGMSGQKSVEDEEHFSGSRTETGDLRIQVSGEDQTILFELNDSAGAESLYEQLPLTILIEDYGGNEKIFYPPQKLETEDTPLTEGGGAGGLAYFEPWGNVVMYYGDFGPYSGLYELGKAVSGSEAIGELSGEVFVEAVEIR